MARERGVTLEVGALPEIVVYGDASFAGEGVVPETLNMSLLAGYGVGGTVHIITNNQVGFTTDAIDGRSTHYASDLAKGFEIPIVHVNADDAEGCVQAVRLAIAYRRRFGKIF
jgi:2-oxoglutarate dehydrogenase E1 component